MSDRSCIYFVPRTIFGVRGRSCSSFQRFCFSLHFGGFSFSSSSVLSFRQLRAPPTAGEGTRAFGPAYRVAVADVLVIWPRSYFSLSSRSPSVCGLPCGMCARVSGRPTSTRVPPALPAVTHQLQRFSVPAVFRETCVIGLLGVSTSFIFLFLSRLSCSSCSL